MSVSRQVRRAQERAAAKGQRPALAGQKSTFVPMEISKEEVVEHISKTLGSHPGRYPKHGIVNDLEPSKGQVFGGECNRTACDRDGATWWNRGTFGFYCKHDAMAINEGHAEPLCIPLKAKPDIETMEALRCMRIAS